MKPDIPIFKPRYPLHLRLLFILAPLFFFGMICSALRMAALLPYTFWMLALIFGLVASLIPFYIIREVRFPDEMVVRRHFLPDQFFTHQEFEQIDSGYIQAAGQRIRIGQITNREELEKMAQRWKADKILKGSQQKKPEQGYLYPQRGYGTYASFWGLMFGVIAILLNPPWLNIDPRWLLGGTFLLVYSIYGYIIPRYA